MLPLLTLNLPVEDYKNLNIKQITRAHDWWGPKLSPILGVGYATLLIAGKNIFDAAPHLFLLLIALIVGAVYVSTINDISDLEEDNAAGKVNRMHKIPATLRWLVPGFCLACGILFALMLLPDYRSLWLYIMPWIVFSLYSIHPIRLKERGIWGLLADACGAHLFPTCFIVSAASYSSGQRMNGPWFIAVATWAFVWGLRGILWHQFHDRERDLSTGTNTYATKVSPIKFKIKALALVVIELLAFGVMLVISKSYVAIIFIPLYMALMFLRSKLFDSRAIIVVPRLNGRYQVVMNEYYQIFFPLQLLVMAAINQHGTWLILIGHVLLFFASFYKGIKEMVDAKLFGRIGKFLKIKLSSIHALID